jgi:hypothetical protein
MGAFENGAEARKHVIMSHGGKHGVGGTYLRGQQMTSEVAKHIPAELIAPVAAPVVVVLSATEAVAPAAAPAPEPPQPQPVERPGTAKPLPPTNIRELHMLNKDELVTLARDLDVRIEGEVTVKVLREALRTGLALG